jgi:basic amino acid/polyamine antiporter, APA family
LSAADSGARQIGRWALTGLMINSIIGSGVFGVPGELARLLGTASPLACIAAGLAVAVIIACFVEVGSQFSDSGGPYLYVRTAFGRMAGIQVAWFTALTPLAAAAAQANLFASYLQGFLPDAPRAAIVIAVVILPLAANLVGLRAGKQLATLLVIAKLVPLLALIIAGFLHPPASTHSIQPPQGAWMSAVLLAVFSFGGFENALAATGAVNRPRQSVPFALCMSLLVCIFLNTAIQWVVSRAVDPSLAATRPLAAAATVLIGPGGASLIAVAALISTSGAISATVLAIPRLLVALAEGGDFPAVFARQRADGTPVIATIAVTVVVVLLGITGTFAWALAVTAGAMAIFSGAVCAALPRLRARQPELIRIRVPGGPWLAVAGVAIAVVLLAQLQATEAALLLVTVALAAINGWLMIRHKSEA